MTRCLVAAVTGDKVLLQHTSWFDFVSFWWKFLEGGRGGIKKGYGEKKKQSKFMSFCSSPSVQAGLCPVTVHPLGSDEGVWRTATSLLCNRQETPGAYKTPNVIWFLRVWRLFAPHTHTGGPTHEHDTVRGLQLCRFLLKGSRRNCQDMDFSQKKLWKRARLFGLDAQLHQVKKS